MAFFDDDPRLAKEKKPVALADLAPTAALARLLAQPVLRILDAKFLSVAWRAATGKRLRVRDAYLMLVGVRIVGAALRDGQELADTNRQSFKSATAELVRFLVQAPPGKDGPNSVRRVFLG